MDQYAGLDVSLKETSIPVRQDHSGEAIAVYDDILARFGTVPELALREQVAKALVIKGAALGALGRGGEAVAVYDDVLARFAPRPGWGCAKWQSRQGNSELRHSGQTGGLPPIEKNLARKTSAEMCVA
ncbi:MAG: hypothetical protein L0Y50_06460 [Beijerinckiaceae bacterium]|nr:hypothetical protein [Beijerinckiaceae bacterium]MCI0735900.1 hypothetical protein [Beijerinckiaceae bacterium]